MKVWIVEEANNYDQPYELIGVVDAPNKAEPLYRTYLENRYNYMLLYDHLKNDYLSSIEFYINRDMIVKEVEVK